MNQGYTAKFMADHLAIPVGKIRQWIRMGYFSELGVTRKRSFRFTNLDEAAEAILRVAGREDAPAPQEKNIFDKIDELSWEDVQEIRVKEELKSLIIKNKKHNQEFILLAEHQRLMGELAHVIRGHFENLPGRLAATVGEPKLEQKVYDFCVGELEILHKKVKALA